jgi:DNA-binding MarR family transcriptional regulator
LPDHVARVPSFDTLFSRLRASSGFHGTAPEDDQLKPEIRAGQALAMWRDVNLSLVRAGEPDLSSRQFAILLTIYLDLPPHTVRGLAEKLAVTKPVITRALDTMGKLGLVTRHRDPLDRRNVIIQRTVAGAEAVDRLAELIVADLKDDPRP